MYRVVVLALTFLMALAAHAEAQNRCSGADGVRLLSPGATVQRPMGFAATSTMALRKSDGTAAPMPPTLPPAMNMWDATTLQAVVKSIGADTGELLWTDADKACTQVIVVRDLPVVAEAVCAGGSAILRAGLAVTTPTGFTSAATAVLRKSDRSPLTIGTTLPPSNGQWDQGTLTLMRTATGANDAQLVWSEMGHTTCVQAVTLPGLAPTETVVSRATTTTRANQETYEQDECDAAGKDWMRVIAPSAGRGFTVVVFDKDGGVCYQNSLRPRQGDIIYVGIFTDEDLAWSRARITFEPCSLESAVPNVLINDRLPTIATERQSGNWMIRHKFPARACFDSSVLINVQSSGGLSFSHALRQATLYRATLHLGTVFTESHETTFGLRPVSPTEKRIFAEGPIDRGPEYVAALVFYSLPRYFSKRGFHGRDPVEDNGWKDRFGGVVGVGLQDPTKRFITGFSFEVAAGVNVLGVWDWAEDNTLRGVSEGDVFTGTVEEIPVQKEWRQKFVFGVSLDLVYAVTAFKR